MKYIYLDQMKWIEIAKYIHHGIHEPSIAHIINLMEEKVGSENGVFLFLLFISLKLHHVWINGQDKN